MYTMADKVTRDALRAMRWNVTKPFHLEGPKECKSAQVICSDLGKLEEMRFLTRVDWKNNIIYVTKLRRKWTDTMPTLSPKSLWSWCREITLRTASLMRNNLAGGSEFLPPGYTTRESPFHGLRSGIRIDTLSMRLFKVWKDERITNHCHRDRLTVGYIRTRLPDFLHPQRLSER